MKVAGYLIKTNLAVLSQNTGLTSKVRESIINSSDNKNLSDVIKILYSFGVLMAGCIHPRIVYILVFLKIKTCL